MDIQAELNRLADHYQLDYFGIADLNSARALVNGMSKNLLRDFRFAISLGVTLPHRIVDGLLDSGRDFARISYDIHAYQVVNDRLNQLAQVFHSFLQRKGYPSYPVPATQRYFDETISSIFSHKLAAHLSGLGWIGKSCLLVTEGDGPRVRWVSVLTDAPLKATGRARKPECGDCRECVDICPAQAFTNRLFHPDEPREMRYHAHRCRDYFDSLKKQSQIPVCGLCLAVCPHGRNRKQGPVTARE